MAMQNKHLHFSFFSLISLYSFMLISVQVSPHVVHFGPSRYSCNICASVSSLFFIYKTTSQTIGVPVNVIVIVLRSLLPSAIF